MIKTVHVLNGDSTVPIFAKSGISGDVVVWREMLCEGQIHHTIGSDEFWKERYAYFEYELGVSKLEYFDRTIKEIVKLEDLSNYSEVVLWFEYDLFCQINLLGLCTYLRINYRKSLTYYLVCPGNIKGKEKLQSLSDLSPAVYTTLFRDKIKLTKNNLQFAEQCWTIYIENSKEKLEAFNFDQCPKFNYLQVAMNQHFQRFPKENGLNQIENKIITVIGAQGFTADEIVEHLLIWQQEETVYGFGDLQYFMYLKRLNKYYEIRNSRYYLNDIGKKYT